MKKIAAILFLFFCFQIVYSQESIIYNKEKLDSIQNLLNSNHTDDTTKVKRLNYLARIYFSNFEYEVGLKATKQARLLAKQLKYKKGEGLYFRTLAVFYLSTDIKAYYNNKANGIFAELKQKEDNFEIEIPELNDKLIKKANNQISSSLYFFEKEEDKEITAHILINGSYFLLPDNQTGALDYLDRAFKLFNEENEIGYATSVRIFKMFMLQSLGKITEANKIEEEVSKFIVENADYKESINFLRYLLRYHNLIGNNFAIKRGLKIEAEIEKIHHSVMQIIILRNLAINFAFLDMSEKAVEYYKRAISIREINYYDNAINIYLNCGFELVALKQLDEAKIYFSKAKELAENTAVGSVRLAGIDRYNVGMGQILMGQEKYLEALDMFNQSTENFWRDFYKAYCYHKLGNLQESLNYGISSYNDATAYVRDQRILLKICLLLSEVYEQLGQTDLSFEYLKKYRNIIEKQKEQDIANSTSNFEIQKIIDENKEETQQFEKEKLLKEKQNQNQRWWLFSIAAGLISSLIVVYLLYRNNNHKQKANAQLERQKQEVENTLSKLKSTQAQLIQSEKMASLGELTAGIAHEIQNPLNFVNNFSEVNSELIIELKEEIEKGDKQEAITIANDIAGNEQKINHHGKRADAIVKGMLQHSRTSTGQKELTDINALADEYLRLSYHGLRAKDKSFNADFKTEFDESLPKINVIPQDIGRVLLNLINNAFYAAPLPPEGGFKEPDYVHKPMVIVSTTSSKSPSGDSRLNDAVGQVVVKISVKDNGPGIPQNIVDKIFQPFFTTKPTGQGTGLGLSLSYDIVKAHGGEITVNSKENEGLTHGQAGTEFIIYLPIS